MSSGVDSVAQLYRSVVNDVIHAVREAFLDEGVDSEVLGQLKNDWESKLVSRGVCDYDGRGCANKRANDARIYQASRAAAALATAAAAADEPSAAAAMASDSAEVAAAEPVPSARLVSGSKVISRHVHVAGNSAAAGGGKKLVYHTKEHTLREREMDKEGGRMIQQQQQQNQQHEQQQVRSAYGSTNFASVAQLAGDVDKCQQAGGVGAGPSVGYLQPGATLQLPVVPADAANRLVTLYGSPLQSLAMGAQQAAAATAYLHAHQQVDNLLRASASASAQLQQQQRQQQRHSANTGDKHMPQLDGVDGLDDNDKQQSSSASARSYARAPGKGKSGGGGGKRAATGAGSDDEEMIDDSDSDLDDDDDNRVESAVLGKLRGKMARDKASAKRSRRDSSDSDTAPAQHAHGAPAQAQGQGQAGTDAAEPLDEAEELNSNDDESDGEDPLTLFDADDVLMCQFERVNRNRNRWRFTLKDGIMHLGDVDYAFSKASGEAEWY